MAERQRHELAASATTTSAPAPGDDLLELRRRAEAAERAEAALAHAGALARLGAWWIDVADERDLNASPLRWSDETYRIFGYEPRAVAVTNDLFFEHVHPDDRRRVRDTVGAALATDGRYAVEHRIVRRDGALRTVLERAEAQRDPAGRLLRMVGVVQDVTAQRQAEAELRASEARNRENQARLEAERARLQAIVDTIPVGFFIVEPGGKVVVTNDEAKRMWRGAAPLERISEYDRYVGYWPDTGERLKAEEWPAAQALMHGRKTKDVMVDIERFDGTRGTILFSGAPIRDGAGHVTGAVVATQDVSALRAAHARLEELDRRKTEFLAMLSHELRNPLAPILNSVYLLERAPPDSGQAARARDVVRRQTEHLTRLVDDLLDVTRISHGKIPLERSTVDLREIVRKTTDDLQSVFAPAGLTLRVEYLTLGPVRVDADATRMAQVLANLLNNAAKFTQPGGSVVVGVAARGGTAELRVVDDGIGMDPRAVQQMFEPFAQADHSLARTRGGLGLGLALVKSIVELHGGSVAARSDGPGRGAEFTIRLPLVGAGAAPEGPRPRDGAAAARTILVIEDNPDGAQSLADLLELKGHRVRIARDGRSGIALARELRPDVVLCDIGLPDVDGYDVARALRREGALGATRLVALSGYAQPEDRRQARDAGFDAHLPKPPDLAELLAAVARNG